MCTFVGLIVIWYLINRTAPMRLDCWATFWGWVSLYIFVAVKYYLCDFVFLCRALKIFLVCAIKTKQYRVLVNRLWSCSWCSGNNQSVGSLLPVVSRWLWPGNRPFSEVASMVVTWWVVAFLHSDGCDCVHYILPGELPCWLNSYLRMMKLCLKESTILGVIAYSTLAAEHQSSKNEW